MKDGIRKSELLVILLFSVFGSLLIAVVLSNIIIPNPSSQSIYTQTFGDVIDLHSNSSTSFPTYLDSSGDNLYIIFVDVNNLNPRVMHYRLNLDSLNSGFEKNNLFREVEGSSYKLVASGNSAYFLWTGNDTMFEDGSNLYLKSSHENGTNFSSRIDSITNISGLSMPQLAASSDNDVYIAWVDLSNTTAPKIHYRVSHDGGKSISRANSVPIFYGSFPKLVAAYSQVHLLWAANDSVNIDTYAMGRHWINQDQYFQSISVQNLSEAASASSASSSSSTADADAVETRSRIDNHSSNATLRVDIKQSNKTDWSILSTDFIPVNANENYTHALDISAKDVNQLHSKVYYYDSNKTELNWDFVFHGRDGTFEDLITTALRTPPDTAYVKLQMWVHPNPMNASSFSLHDTNIRQSDIYIRSSHDNGTNFGPRVTIDNDIPGLSSPPQLAASGNNVYVVWVGNNSIYLRSSHDNGTNFGPKININKNAGISTIPDLSATGNSAYIGWLANFNGTIYPYVTSITNFENRDVYKEVRLSLEQVSNSSGIYVTSSDSRAYIVWDNKHLSGRGSYLKVITGTTFPFTDDSHPLS